MLCSDLLGRIQQIIGDGVQKQSKRLFIAGAMIYCLTGLMTLYNASSGYTVVNYGDAAYFVKKQLWFILLGAAVAVALQKIPVDRLARLKIRWLVIACLCVSVYVTIAGLDRLGIHGWFYLLNIPARVGDVLILLHLLILVKAYFYDRDKFNGRHFPKLVLLIQFSAWIFPYHFPDRGVFVSVFLDSMFVLLALGRYTAVGGIAGVYLMLLAPWFFISSYASRWLGNIRDALLLDRHGDLSYQLWLSIENMTSGGFWGRWDYWTVEAGQLLPDAHLGFIFSYFVKNAGLAGTILLMTSLLLLLVNIMKPLKVGKLTYPALLTLALGGLFFSQCLIGMATAVGLFPANNIGIPVFSLQPMHTIEAFVTFGLLYKQLDMVCVKTNLKVRFTESAMVVCFGIFALIFFKISYHMIKGLN